MASLRLGEVRTPLCAGAGRRRPLGEVINDPPEEEVKPVRVQNEWQRREEEDAPELPSRIGGVVAIDEVIEEVRLRRARARGEFAWEEVEGRDGVWGRRGRGRGLLACVAARTEGAMRTTKKLMTHDTPMTVYTFRCSRPSFSRIMRRCWPMLVISVRMKKSTIGSARWLRQQYGQNKTGSTWCPIISGDRISLCVLQ